MSYSQKRLPNDESEFPTPPLWLVWYSDRNYPPAGQPFASTQGQVRHLATLARAKKQVSPYRGGGFPFDWAIYHWESDRYVKKYEGLIGEPSKGHPLFKKGAVTDGLQGQPRDALEEEVEEALASIRTVLMAAREEGWQPA
jgi:hypothetical protein